MIQPGDTFPDATLWESTEIGEKCPISSEKVETAAALKGKKVVVFGLPGAFTQTCSNKHVPGYLAHFDAMKAKGVDEIWCISVNDGETMAAWGHSLHARGNIRFLGDGDAVLTKKLGIERQIEGMGTRMRRCSFLVDDGVVKAVNVEQPGKFEVSNAETMLKILA